MQTVQTHIRLLLEEHFDQGLHCLLNRICIFRHIVALKKNKVFNLSEITIMILSVPNLFFFHGKLVISVINHDKISKILCNEDPK